MIIGVLCFLLMLILRLPYAFLISIVVGITNMIPYFGPFIGAVPGILVILFISPVQALIFAIMILCLQQFDGLILGPKILGSSTGMTPLWIIFAITVGGSLAGIIGMFLGVPVVAFLNYLGDRYLSHLLRKKHISETTIDNAVQKMELDD
jgi:predicted PurR-regulated permease PerM